MQTIKRRRKHVRPSALQHGIVYAYLACPLGGRVTSVRASHAVVGEPRFFRRAVREPTASAMILPATTLFVTARYLL